MKWIRNLVSLPRPRRADATEDERVMDLFRNRIELKKTLAGVQEEVEHLRDRVKQQEGATARVREMLEDLEQKLAKPESAYQALVYYQLRELWRDGRELLRVLLEELSTQRETRERREHLAEINQQRFAERVTLDDAVRSTEQRLGAARAAAALAQSRLNGLGGWWRILQRRTAARQLASEQAAVAAASLQCEQCAAQLATFDAQQPADFPGLSVDARRAANLTVIAYAHVLRERAARANLYDAARAASRRREPPEQPYGSRADCERMMADIQRARAVLADRSTLARDIGALTDNFRSRVEYAEPAATVPDAESLVTAQDSGGSTVLQEDAWELSLTLLR